MHITITDGGYVASIGPDYTRRQTLRNIFDALAERKHPDWEVRQSGVHWSR